MAFMTRDKGPLPPVILLLSLAAQVALHFQLPFATALPQPLNWTGIVAIVIGLGVIASPALAFRRSDTTIIPFRESSLLVVNGMYRITRNPMYLGMVIILSGVAMLTGSLSPFLVPPLFVLILNTRVIRHEEAMLEAQFGAEYRDYLAQVRRWL